jgi:hypothetical protein
VSYLHAIANGRIAAAEAVKAYHGDLEKLGIKPYRALKDDLELTAGTTSYAPVRTAVIPRPAMADFRNMTPAQKLAYSRQRIRG